MKKESYKDYHRIKSREQYLAHKDEYKKRARIWGFEHPDKKVTDPVYQKEYREKNRDKINQKERENNQKSMEKAYSAKNIWTEEEYQRLCDGVLEGKTYEEIGEELGRSVKAVEHAKRRRFPELVADRMKRHNPYTGEAVDDAGN